MQACNIKKISHQNRYARYQCKILMSRSLATPFLKIVLVIAWRNAANTVNAATHCPLPISNDDIKYQHINYNHCTSLDKTICNQHAMYVHVPWLIQVRARGQGASNSRFLWNTVIGNHYFAVTRKSYQSQKWLSNVCSTTLLLNVCQPIL